MRLVLFGPPGSGKGTQAQLLKDREGLALIGTGDMLRAAVEAGTPLGRKVEPLMREGQLVPDDLVNGIVAEYFARHHPVRFVLDGYPRTVPQAEVFDQLLQRLNLNLGAVVLMVIDEDEVIRRLAGRGRSDDSAETVVRRLREYNHNVAGVLAHYKKQGLLREVKANDTVENVHAQIVRLLQGPPGGPPC
jgi:adenylate kinase